MDRMGHNPLSSASGDADSLRHVAFITPGHVRLSRERHELFLVRAPDVLSAGNGSAFERILSPCSCLPSGSIPQLHAVSRPVCQCPKGGPESE